MIFIRMKVGDTVLLKDDYGDFPFTASGVLIIHLLSFYAYDGSKKCINSNHAAIPCRILLIEKSIIVPFGWECMDWPREVEG